jgi:hypothetical protein
MAFEKKFDTAIIFSLDTDLKPALEFVQKLQPKTEIFVAAWRKKSSEPRQLSLKGNYPNCIWLNQEDYLNSLLN